jgi:hypothetical protein
MKYFLVLCLKEVLAFEITTEQWMLHRLLNACDALSSSGRSSSHLEAGGWRPCPCTPRISLLDVTYRCSQWKSKSEVKKVTTDVEQREQGYLYWEKAKRR